MNKEIPRIARNISELMDHYMEKTLIFVSFSLLTAIVAVVAVLAPTIILGPAVSYDAQPREAFGVVFYYAAIIALISVLLRKKYKASGFFDFVNYCAKNLKTKNSAIIAIWIFATLALNFILEIYTTQKYNIDINIMGVDSIVSVILVFVGSFLFWKISRLDKM